MPYENPPHDDIKRFLTGVRTIAVLGLSTDPDRPSYSVAMYMQSQGFKIIPVRPGGGEILGERVFEKLSDIPHPVDVVDVFRHSKYVAAHVDEILALPGKAIWLQEGVIDHAAAERARKAGLFVVQDRCILKEHRKHGIGRVAG
ncbi:MAG: CoA-binding protein [Deltaproteobacteria bacterium]|nr:CoA-binding protein [Deltaproteobacteria bacterium]